MATKEWLKYTKMIRGGKETRSRLRRIKRRNNAKQLTEVKTNE